MPKNNNSFLDNLRSQIELEAKQNQEKEKYENRENARGIIFFDFKLLKSTRNMIFDSLKLWIQKLSKNVKIWLLLYELAKSWNL